MCATTSIGALCTPQRLLNANSEAVAAKDLYVDLCEIVGVAAILVRGVCNCRDEVVFCAALEECETCPCPVHEEAVYFAGAYAYMFYLDRTNYMLV